MPANIQVILQQDVDKLGKSGELVRVRPGFARNYLLAAAARRRGDDRRRPANRAREGRRARARREGQEGSARGRREDRAPSRITIAQKAGDDGRLFGSVTTKDIAAAFAAKGVVIDRRKIAPRREPSRASGATSSRSPWCRTWRRRSRWKSSPSSAIRIASAVPRAPASLRSGASRIWRCRPVEKLRARRWASGGVDRRSKARVPPHDLDAEAAVLSAVMLDPLAFDKVNEFLRPEHFYSEAHRRIYEACIELQRRRQAGRRRAGRDLAARPRPARAGRAAWRT